MVRNAIVVVGVGAALTVLEGDVVRDAGAGRELAEVGIPCIRRGSIEGGIAGERGALPVAAAIGAVVKRSGNRGALRAGAAVDVDVIGRNDTAGRWIVAGAGNDDARARARSLATYGVLAFVVLLIFWGVVNLLTDSLGLAGCTMPQSDYFLQGFIGPMPANCSNLPPAG